MQAGICRKKQPSSMVFFGHRYNNVSNEQAGLSEKSSSPEQDSAKDIGSRRAVARVPGSVRDSASTQVRSQQQAVPATPPAEGQDVEGTALAAVGAGSPESERLARREARRARRREKNRSQRESAPQIEVLPTAPPARRKRHHIGVILSFVLMVLGPVAGACWYLYERAVDQYASTMGFTIRQEDSASASDVLGGFGLLGGSTTSSDADILYHFIQSQGLVQRIDERLDLREIWSRPERDPYFAITDDASVEELLDYWARMVTIFYDGTTGLIETRVLAFTPEDAQAISRAIFEEGSAVINRLSAVAQEDATQYARDELALAEERLREARAAVTDFRSRTQMVDPQNDIQGQMGLLNNLQAQLAEALIELDLLRENTREADPRIRQAEQRIVVIEDRIAAERMEFGSGEADSDKGAYAMLVGEYEDLAVDREFAEQSYLAARANLDAALAEAQKKTRYLAAYAEPTLAETSEYPKRVTTLLVLFASCFAFWGVLTLIYYSIRDRR